MTTPRLPPAVFAAAYLVVSGAVVLVTKGLVLLPLVGWLRQRTDHEIALFLRLSGKALIAIGLAVLLLWGLKQRRTQPAAPPTPPE